MYKCTCECVGTIPRTLQERSSLATASQVMIVKACLALQNLPSSHARVLSDSRHVQVSSRSVFASTGNLSRLQSRHCQSIRTCLNATDSSEQDQPYSPEQLAHELQDAVRQENYQKAAELRDVLKSLQPQDTVAALKKKMEQYVAEDKFEVSCVLCAQNCLCTLNHVCLAVSAAPLTISCCHRKQQQSETSSEPLCRKTLRKPKNGHQVTLLQRASEYGSKGACQLDIHCTVNKLYLAATNIVDSIGGRWCHTLFVMQLLRAESVISRSEAVLLCLLCHDQ